MRIGIYIKKSVEKVLGFNLLFSKELKRFGFVNLRNTDLRGADFRSALIDSPSAAKIELTGAILKGAKLPYSGSIDNEILESLASKERRFPIAYPMTDLQQID